YNAAQTLDGLPPEAAAGLRTQMNHPKPDVAGLAASHVFRRDPTDAAAAKMLKDNVRWESIVAFENAGAPGVPHPAQVVARPPAGAAARALARMAPDVPLPAEALAGAIPGADETAAYPLLIALGRCGERAKPHLDVVREALKNPSPE